MIMNILYFLASLKSCTNEAVAKFWNSSTYKKNGVRFSALNAVTGEAVGSADAESSKVYTAAIMQDETGDKFYEGGYASPVSFVVKQGKGLIEQGDGKYRSVNEWVAEYMKSRYLWNRAIENVSLDYSLCYDFFFFSILDGVAAQDEVNREDGHWQG
jgi:hypothetical protein